MKFKQVIAIVGPTASGKSAVALAFAGKTGGEIVNADSRQIYRFLDAGTSKPDGNDREIVPHHLYDFLLPGEPYSAGEYARQAGRTLSDILMRGKTPVVVGGTGLYVRALFDGLARLPMRDENFRSAMTAISREQGRDALHERLVAVDPVSAARIPAQNIQRVIRALEVHSLTGRPLSVLHRDQAADRPPFQPRYFGIHWDRTILKERIATRCRDILPGMIEETERLLARGFRDSDPGFQSLGYRSVIRFLKGETSRDRLLETLTLDTFHYAKRQMTWFRKEKKIRWIESGNPFDPERAADTINRYMV